MISRPRAKCSMSAQSERFQAASIARAMSAKVAGSSKSRDADGGAARGGLHDQAGAHVASSPLRGRERVLATTECGCPLRDRESRGRERDPRVPLVHRERAREDPRPDVGELEDLEEPLERSVLADRAVRRREDDVVAPRAQRLREERPELEPHGTMSRLGERRRDRRGRRAAHLGLRRGAPLNDGD